MLGRDLVLSTEQLSIDAFDYAALGHIHSHQSVTARPPSVYAGSLERIDFGEERDTKGFVEVTIDLAAEPPRRAEWTFHELPARRYLTIRVDATGRDPEIAVEREVRRRTGDIRGAIVRCRVSVAADHEDRVRVNDVRSLIESLGAYSVAQVSLDSPAVTRLRISIQDDQAQDAGYLLEQWLKLRDLPDATRKRIHTRGLDIIRSHHDEPAEAP
jgi:DNA repair protein SbcD/Mre11